MSETPTPRMDAAIDGVDDCLDWEQIAYRVAAEGQKLERELTAEREQIAAWQEKATVWMASPEAAKRLAGYREIADKCCTLEAERDAARARVEKLEAGLLRITDHFAAVMGGPLVTGRGIEFETGVEGIPTIANARALLSPSPEPQP